MTSAWRLKEAALEALQVGEDGDGIDLHLSSISMVVSGSPKRW